MRKVVYTALTNAYDSLMQISCVNPEYDYICFSNEIEYEKIGIWNIRKIPFDTKDKQRLSRFPKLQPYKVLPEYDLSIYIDANVDILTETVYRHAEKFFEQGVLLAGLKHQLRKCIYRESFEIMIRGIDHSYKRILSQMRHYIAEGFPFDYGMYEANVIYRKHNDPSIVRQCDEWWFWQKNYSRRDQLSYSYTLWKNNIPFHYLLPENEWSRNSLHLSCKRHPQSGSFIEKCWSHFKEHQLAPVLTPLFFPIYKSFLLRGIR